MAVGVGYGVYVGAAVDLAVCVLRASVGVGESGVATIILAVGVGRGGGGRV